MNTRYTLFKDTYVMYSLLEFISESRIIELCKVNKKLNVICKQYIELEDDKRFEVIVTTYMYTNSNLLQKYCMNNDVIKIRKMINMDLYWDFGLRGACRGGHIDTVKFLIEKGADWWNHGLYYACFGGYIDIIDLMIKKGGDVNWGLNGACGGGHTDIVKFLIGEGADAWNIGLYHACKGSHTDIVKLLADLIIKRGGESACICQNCKKTIEEHLDYIIYIQI